jgi:small conductance mechanosensitive channel
MRRLYSSLVLVVLGAIWLSVPLATPLAAQFSEIDKQIQKLEEMKRGLGNIEQLVGDAAGGGQEQKPAGLFDSLQQGQYRDASAIIGALVVGVLVKIGQFASVFAGFWLLATIVRKMILRAGRHNAVDSHLAIFMGRVARTTLLIVGAISGVATMGVDVTALVAGLGLTGFALGFALKDVVSNVVAGVLILIYRPVVAGEHVKVKTFEGLILSTDLRYTVLQAGEQVIYVPNSIMFTDAITVDRKDELPAEEVEIEPELVPPEDVVPLESDPRQPPPPPNA